MTGGGNSNSGAAGADSQARFAARLAAGRAQSLGALRDLYGRRSDFAAIAERVFAEIESCHRRRPAVLRELDNRRQRQPDWFEQPGLIGYTCYVDRFAGSFNQVVGRIPYLKSLGVSYLHLLSVLKARPGDSDGGFAIEDYRQTNPQLGSIDELEQLAAALRAEGISLCVDFVYNHTAREHAWARRAMAGERRYRDYYFVFDSETQKRQYEPWLQQVFPVSAPGNFTFEQSLDAWVWTTFYPFQWDLNYQNPQVFVEMLKNLLYLANRGVEVFRMDAAAFSWKRAGTDCLNQPETHALLRALRALVGIAAPSVVLKVEAIVGAAQATMYFGAADCRGREGHIAYHNALMASLWRSLAQENAAKTLYLLRDLPRNPPGTAWVNYLRCHDDIGWGALLDERGANWSSDEAELQRVVDFYDGLGEGGESYARGRRFQTQAGHQVHGTNGTLASLAGLERALQAGDPGAVDLAVARITLLHSVIFSQSGVPLINMGDEVGLLNDYGQADRLGGDGRWLHRPVWHRPENPLHCRAGDRILAALQAMLAARGASPVFHARAEVQFIELAQTAVLASARRYGGQTVLTLANFSAQSCRIDLQSVPPGGAWRSATDLLGAVAVDGDTVALAGYGRAWLQLQQATDYPE